jgi:hypothetical protein
MRYSALMIRIKIGRTSGYQCRMGWTSEQLEAIRPREWSDLGGFD